jgi:hypothetical protein
MKRDDDNSIFSTEVVTTPSNAYRNQSPPFKIVNNTVEPTSAQKKQTTH